MSQLEKRFPWLRSLRDGKARVIGNFRVIAREGKAAAAVQEISLGGGAFMIPLVEGWRMRPAGPFAVSLTTPEGELQMTLDCHEDPAAARGERRILDYLGDLGDPDSGITPDEALASVSVGFFEDGPGTIVWKWLEPLGTTRLRELTLRFVCDAAHSIDRRKGIAGNIVNWLQFGGFASEETEFDRLARSAELERHNFEDTIQLRVPRSWKVEPKNQVLGRRRYSADEPNERETLWVHSTLQRICGRSETDRLQRFYRIADEVADPQFLMKKGWADPSYSTLPCGDLLARGEMRDSDEVGELRTVSWIRLSLRGDRMITSVFQLCTGAEFLDAPEQRASLEIFEREIRAAAILSPVPDAR